MCHETSLKSLTDTVALVVTRLPPTLNTLLANAPNQPVEPFKGRCVQLRARQAWIWGGQKRRASGECGEWSLNCGQMQTLSKWAIRREQAVWPRAAVNWARCRNDTRQVEQYHLGPSAQGVNLVSVPIRRQRPCFNLHQKAESFYFRMLMKWHIWNRVMHHRVGRTTATMFFNYGSRRGSIVCLRPRLLAVSTNRRKISAFQRRCVRSCVMVHCHVNNI